MKITGMETYRVWNGARNFLFVAVDTDEGVWGIGEAGLTGREPAVEAAVQQLAAQLVGADPFRIEHLWQTMFRGGFFPAQRILSSAISAIDIALWDIKGKALGVPIYELLGGRVRDKVVCYPHNQIADDGLGAPRTLKDAWDKERHAQEIDLLVRSCLATQAEGWKFVRWGLPQDGDILEPRPSVYRAIAQLEAVRAAVGDEIEICFDVHTRLDLPDALWLCREAERFRPFFIEDPLRCENPDSFKTLRPRTTAPLAAGEQFSSKWEFRQLVEEEWIDYARIDLCIVGGFTEARKIAGWCETHYIKTALHNPLGPVSSAACLHLNLATSNFGVQEQPSKPGSSLTDIVSNVPRWEDGYLLPPREPGLGLDFNRDAAREQEKRDRSMPALRRLDGSFTNW